MGVNQPKSGLLLLSLICALAATGSAGCSSDGEVDAGVTDTGVPPRDAGLAEDGGTVPADAGHPDGGSAPRDAGEAPCGELDPVDPTRDPSCQAGTWITGVAGTLQTSAGAPLADAFAQVCLRLESDFLVCLRPTPSCADGRYVANVPENARCVASAALRALLPEPGFATTYCHMELPAQGTVLESAVPVPLYPVTAPADLPPEGDRSAARSITFAGGLEVELTPAAFFEPYAELAAVRLPEQVERPCFLPEQPFDAVWGLAPEADIDGEGFPIRIPNEHQLPAGTVVDLFVLGGLSCHLADGTLIPEADWETFGTATVNAEGTFIEGGRLPCLNWFAYRARR